MTSDLTAQHHICLYSVPDKKDASCNEWSIFFPPPPPPAPLILWYMEYELFHSHSTLSMGLNWELLWVTSS